MNLHKTSLYNQILNLFPSTSYILFLPYLGLKKKHLQSRLLGLIARAAFLTIVKICEHRSAAKHCVQVRLRFNILDEREIKKWRKKEKTKE